MALSKENLKSMLDNDETDYAAIVKSLGIENLEHLKAFAAGKDVMLAQKSIYLASLMKDNAGIAVLESAAKSSVELKKIAAASGLDNLKSGDAKIKLSEQLILSNDISVQKLVLGSVQKTGQVSTKLKLQIEDLSTKRGTKLIKDLSKVTLKKIK